jgi:DNA-binding YbaB/EbfC family protein
MNINPFDILKNAQKIQEQMGSIQEKLGDLVVTGSAGGGMVEIDLNGRLEMTGIRIANEALDPPDIPLLQDLIKAAYTGATEKVREAVSREMGALTGIPGFPGPGSFPGLGGGYPGP